MIILRRLNMVQISNWFQCWFTRPLASAISLAACIAIIIFISVESASANHPVLVEGNCLGTGATARTTVTPGTCGDYDGDGRVGTAEDTDEEDRVFGTINGALGSTAGNGSITIVSSGIFNEQVSLGGASNNLTLQAAPGVEAAIDAVRQGDRIGGVRQQTGGILVTNSTTNALSNVVIRNITIRNWKEGLFITGNVRVTVENCRFENNLDHGIIVAEGAEVTVTETKVVSTGYRLPAVVTDSGTTLQPNPGTGIAFESGASGTIFLTTVSGSRATGIANNTGRANAVCAYLVNIFGNGTNFENVRPTADPCGAAKRGRDFFDR